MRYISIRYIFLLGSALVNLLCHHVIAQGNKLKPNIILIYADDLGIMEIEPYGQEKIRTPHLTRLAKEGMRFTNHYTGSPVCAPARGMLMTGKHSGQTYIRGNYALGGNTDSLEAGQMPLPEGTFTIAHMFQRMGYKTGAIGKWGLGMHNGSGSPNRQGFDYFFGYLDQRQAHNYYPSHLWENDQRYSLNNLEKIVHQPLDSTAVQDKDFDFFKGNDYAPELMTEKALGFINENKDEPFFLYLPYTIPHVSLQVPDKYVEKYQDKFNDTPYYGQDGYAAHRYPRAAYAAMITYLDEQIGKVMEEVKELGLDDNTLILFSSDNGTAFNGGVDYAFFNSVGNYRGLKMDVFEGGIRVPFIARWPDKIAASTVSDHVSAQYDLLATLGELVGYSITNTNGISFLPTLLQRGKQKEHEFLYFEYPEKGGQLAVRMQQWKGVKLNLKKDPHARWMLFNLHEDPYEEHDVAIKHPDILMRLDEIVKWEHWPAHIVEWEIIDNKSDRR
ncbi:arylsulfatase [Sphingobacterium chuzhouense]|uniref:Arylsulfatase n=1 Tax=Sphingobacterium chuzhouense TaxID=1742264 RepID=A0ABR7XP52_9SPHI|nr:arylsulfatase [Sphingobacterium chuzhouense]MBD1420944.1 arylsulfatase [Sphingobacterium chuzhouense]